MTKGALDSFTFEVAGPKAVTLPELTGWKTADESAYTALDYDDTTWPLAAKQTTNNPLKPSADQPVLYADDYGFHHGDVYYRGHFHASGAEDTIEMSAVTGSAGVWSAWLNGVYLGSSGGGGGSFAIPAGVLHADADNVVTALVRNMGHNQTYGNNAFKEARGLIDGYSTSARCLAASP